MIKNTNDGTSQEPYLRTDLGEGTLSNLPATSTFPNVTGDQKLQAIKQAGFQGIQGGDIAAYKRLSLGATTAGRVNQLGEIDKLAAEWKAAGYECSTLHVAWGFEDDSEVDRLVEDILQASSRQDFPLYIETHRATITNDPFRTLRIVRKFPEVRFNGDFSHWYTGAEMVYGDFESKLDLLAPVFDRVRYIHGRIGNPGCMQVDIGDGKGRTYVDHFREIWTRSFTGFLKSAKPGDYICFAPELLFPSIFYARVFPNAQGEMVEECDRWQQAILYCQIARECFAQARQRAAGK